MSDKKNPVEEFLLEKNGFDWGHVAGKARDAAIGGATTALVGAAAAGVGLAASKMVDAVTKGHDFRMMLENNPDLVEHHEHDPKMFNQMFSTLRNMNPEFSKDPLVAGSYMRRMVESPMPGGVAVEALGHRDSTPHPMFESFARGGLEGAKEWPKHQMSGQVRSNQR